MNDILNENNNAIEEKREGNLVELSENLLLELHSSIDNKQKISVPIAEISTLGAAVSSILPSLNTMTQTTTFPVDGLYKLANAEVGEVLKQAKDGTFWGSLKKADGGSKMLKLAEASPLEVTTKTVLPVNPAVMMMAATLYSVEKELGKIEKTTQDIIFFLENEKESKIEAHLRNLTNIMKQYKHSCTNELFVKNNHNQVLEIQNSARTYINSYRKDLNHTLSSKNTIVDRSKLKSQTETIEKKFQYYRMAIYIFSLASLLEVMLGENYNEGHIGIIKEEIEAISEDYDKKYNQSSKYLKKMGRAEIGMNVVKGVGIAENVAGRAIAAIPGINKGPVDEILIGGGAKLKRKAKGMELQPARKISDYSSCGAELFINKLDDVISIYNKTTEICFDSENIYLITE